MVRGCGVEEGRVRRRCAAFPDHRVARRYHSAWPRGTRRRSRGSTHGAHSPSRGGTACREKKDPEIVEVLTQLAEPVTGGDPMSGDKYVRRSLQTLSDELADCGFQACATTVGQLLRDLDYKLRVNFKRLTGPAHPDRDRQFGYLGDLIEAFRQEGLPILSIDATKKELIGNFDKPGERWLPKRNDVNAHDFLSDAEYRVTPYGLYDLLANQGHVIVGTSYNTPEFAAACVARWWSRIGCH